MVEVFKTNVDSEVAATRLTGILQQHFPDGVISFDLEDRDKVLRVESECCGREIIVETVISGGFSIEELSD